MTPTQRSLKLLRETGYIVWIVEKYNSFVHQRIDVWGFGDLLATKGSMTGSILIQTTTQAHQSERFKKILAIPEAHTWLMAGNQIVVHGWRKVGARGKRKLWECKVRPITLADFGEPMCPISNEEFILA